MLEQAIALMASRNDMSGPLTKGRVIVHALLHLVISSACEAGRIDNACTHAASKSKHNAGFNIFLTFAKGSAAARAATVESTRLPNFLACACKNCATLSCTFVRHAHMPDMRDLIVGSLFTPMNQTQK